jgi:hypothetical protein
VFFFLLFNLENDLMIQTTQPIKTTTPTTADQIITTPTTLTTVEIKITIPIIQTTPTTADQTPITMADQMLLRRRMLKNGMR